VVLQIDDEAKPKETSTDRIERVLAELTAQAKDDRRPIRRRWKVPPRLWRGD